MENFQDRGLKKFMDPDPVGSLPLHRDMKISIGIINLEYNLLSNAYIVYYDKLIMENKT